MHFGNELQDVTEKTMDHFLQVRMACTIATTTGPQIVSRMLLSAYGTV